MDLDTLTSLVIEKFNYAGGYSELDKGQLYKTVKTYLETIYTINIYKTQKRIEAEEKMGIFPNKETYRKEYSAVEDYVMNCANRLAASTKEEI